MYLKEIKMPHTLIRHIISHSMTFLLLVFSAKGQNNVGIGTAAPHPSAILEVSDSSRGVLIPRTDTVSVLNYVNTLNPSPGITDGLMIFDTLLNTYVYYSETEDKWKVLIDLVGPPGPQGPKGPRGPQGDTGTVNDWRDSIGFDEVILARDTCGDYFLDAGTGRIWRVWCDTLGGSQPRRWVDTVLWDKPIGNLQAPEERVVAGTVHGGSVFLESMANDTSIVLMKPVPGLSMSFLLAVDEIAYVWAAAHGTASKAFSGEDISYAQYDIQTSIGQFYQSNNVQHILTLGPNGPPGNTGRADFGGWYLSAFGTFSADISPPIPCRCFTPWQACVCSHGPSFVTIDVYAGNRYSGSTTTSFLVLSDEVQKENVGHLSILAIIRRNPNAPPRKR